MNSCGTLNGAKPHAINVQFQALLFDIIRVTFWWIIDIYKLTTAVRTNVMSVYFGAFRFSGST
jgi:hypothetical protein